LNEQPDSAANCAELAEIALKCGFTCVRPLDPQKIRVRQEVREACAENKCGYYGNNWACPPACGELSDCADRIHGYESGIIMQTTGRLADEFDWDGMLRLGEEHAARVSAFSDAVLPCYPRSLVLGAGGCRVCEPCAYPAPCRFPQKMTCSMEAYGMLVSEVCSDNGLKYYYGAGTLTYVACFLTRRPQTIKDKM
jgi:predicted metal-binding protein